MKKHFCLISLILSGASFSQVGIDTYNPKSTLDVVGKITDPNIPDGILAPRMTGDQLRAKNNAYGIDQNGVIVYVISADTSPAGKTINVISANYYYYDALNSVWMALKGSTSLEPWKIQTTSNSAVANTDNIYQAGKVAVGFSAADAVSTKQFEVKGDFKSQVTNGAIVYGTEVNSPLNPASAMHYWMDGATGNYRVASANLSSASLEAKTGATTNTVTTAELEAAMSSQNGTNSLSTIRTTNTGNFFMETYNVADNYGSTISLQNDGLRLVHTTTNGSADPFPFSNRSEILLQKTNGVGFDLRDAAGVVKANYWLPTTTGTAGQVLTRSIGAGGKTEWKNVVATASNGLTATAGNIKLGGTLSDATTTIATNGNTNALAISGLGTVAATDKLLALDASNRVKTVDISSQFDNLGIPRPAVYQLATDGTYLEGVGVGGFQSIPMQQVTNKTGTAGVTFTPATNTILFRPGLYQITFVYESGGTTTSTCSLSSYIVDFPVVSGTTVTRIHSTAAHNTGGTQNHGGSLIYTTRITGNTNWQVRLGRGQSGNCNNAGTHLKALSTHVSILKLE